MEYDIGAELIQEIELRSGINADKINTSKLLTLTNVDVKGLITGKYEV